MYKHSSYKTHTICTSFIQFKNIQVDKFNTKKQYSSPDTNVRNYQVITIHNLQFTVTVALDNYIYFYVQIAEVKDNINRDELTLVV